MKNSGMKQLHYNDDENPRHAAGYEDESVNPSEQEYLTPSISKHSEQSAKTEASSTVLLSDDDDKIYQLNDDVYSMIFLAPKCSAAFLYSTMTFVLKIVIYIFIMVDMLGGSNSSNPLNIPKGISSLVRAAQCIMLPVAVAIQEDLIASIALFNVKFRPGEDMRQLPGATVFKWVLGSVCRFIDGLISLVVNFVLLEKSDTVLGLMLNFAALGFLQTIDNIAFHLALEGYLSDGIEAVAKAATVLSLPKYKSSRVWSVLDSFFIVIVYLALLGVWISLTMQQVDGKFLCQSFSASFTGDEWWLDFNPSIYSGAYDKVSHRINGRAVYVERNYRDLQDSSQARGIFGYCGEDNVWGYIVTSKATNEITSEDICNYILASSDAAAAYDPTDTVSSEWMMHNEGEIPRSVPASYEIACIDCSNADDCSERGQCQNKKCVCDPPYYGMVCDLKAE